MIPVFKKLQNRDAWTTSQKIIFRFCCIFFGYNIIPSLLPFPIGDDWLAQCVGKYVFHIPHLIRDPLGGSGDSQFDWVWEFTALLVASVGTLIWSIFDSKRQSYTQAKWSLDLLVRYFLIYNLLTYGLIKVFALQMPAPSDSRLWQHVGDMSPMGMLWTFMGSSTPFQMFSGFAEVTAGILLLFRRILLVGALMATLVMLHVFTLNMCYDVPVKIFSFMLFLYSSYLVTPYIGNLYNFFIINKPTEPYPIYKISDKKWVINTELIVKLVFAGALIYSNYSDWRERKVHMSHPPSALEGNFVIDSGPQKIGGEMWTNLSIRDAFNRKILNVTNEELGTRKRWLYSNNDTTKLLKLMPIDNKDSVIASMHYAIQDSMHLVLEGVFQKDSISLHLSKRLLRDFILVKRGFHWVNNEPFNR